jgi:hypothetical protein
MDPEMLEEFKGRQAKIAHIKNSMQGGNLNSGYVSISTPNTEFTSILHSVSALPAGDEEPKTSGARAQPTSQNRNRGNKSRKR